MNTWPKFAYAVVLLVAVIAGVVYTNHVQRDSERKWCDILVIVTAAPVPDTDRGRAMAAALFKLRREFGC